MQENTCRLLSACRHFLKAGAIAGVRQTAHRGIVEQISVISAAFGVRIESDARFRHPVQAPHS
jgi:hypothetical protein